MSKLKFLQRVLNRKTEILVFISSFTLLKTFAPRKEKAFFPVLDLTLGNTIFFVFARNCCDLLSRSNFEGRVVIRH